MLKTELIEKVLQLTGKEESEVLKLKIEAKLNEILSYLNRKNLDEEIFPVVCTVIADCITNDNDMGNIQSLSEGDMSISFGCISPFFGRLEGFKKVRGLDDVQER